MTFDTYLRILRDRLEESGVDATTLQKTIEREKATLQGIASDDAVSLFSEERLSVIIASAAHRSNSQAKDTRQKVVATLDEQSTIATHSSHRVTASISDIPPSDDKTILPVDPAKTAVVAPSSLPQALLDSDTATVVISRAEMGDESNSSCESATTVMPVSGNDSVNKLLSDFATVRISEKDTAEFFVTNSEMTAPVPVSLEIEGSFDPDVTVNVNEETNLLPLIEEAHRQKKNHNLSNGKLSPDLSPASAISDSDLKNLHPKLLLVGVLFILLPCLAVLLALWGVIFLTGALILSVLVVLPVIFYVLTVSFSGGGSLYSLYYSFLFLRQADYAGGFKSIGFTVICVAVCVISVMFLHRFVLPIYRYFLSKLRGFLHFHAVLWRSVLKNLLKNVKNI